MKKAIKLFTSVLIATAVFTFIAGGASASSVKINDNFSHLNALNPQSGGNWWVLNTGLYDGYYNVYNDFCGDGTCVVDKGSFVSLEVYDHAVDGNYYNAELADMQTGYSYGLPTEWNPEVGHPVKLETRVRWSGNYNLDGTGAVGTSGIWLWNSPIDYTNFAIQPTDAFGVIWAKQESVFIPGLNVVALDESYPFAASPVNINMQEWNTFKYVWGENADGSQYLEMYVNDVLALSTPLYTPMENLSVEIWNDNQTPVDYFGTLKYEQPSVDQAFQLDYLHLSK